MKILITGSDGFLAKNLIEHLKRDENLHLYLFSKKDSLNILESYLKEADFVFHLAGVNRPKNVDEFYEGNSSLTKIIVDILKTNNKNTSILFSSSIQASLNNDYGKSKKEAEDTLLAYTKSTNSKVFIYRLANVFGKFSKPNYNSVISTWCYNIANDLSIEVSDEKVELNLVYIDDVIQSFIKQLKAEKIENYFIEIENIYKKTLGEIRDLLLAFKESRKTLLIPNVASGFERALYSTYLSYLATSDFAYALSGHKDERGTFYEILKTLNSGQFSLSTTAPGVTRGNHYHHSKNEKFLVVKGEALIEFRHILTNEIISYKVSDKEMKIVDMIPGYTHNIKNIGKKEMILFLWANENFDQQNPDTYFLKVRNND